MTRTEIIELCNTLTERKGERQLSMPTIYRLVLQDIAKRQRFWWRRLVVSFTLTNNVKTYDLTNATTFPALTDIAFDEISKITLVLTPNPLQVSELLPIFDPEAIIEMTQNAVLGQPGRYTMQGDHIILVDPPDTNYTAYLAGWAMPNPPNIPVSDVVPLIPTYHHNVIVSGMNAKIFKFAYGSKNDKTMDAIAEYELGLQDIMAKKQFDPNYRNQLSFAESAVRST
jgi:hypothetical protein